MITLLKHARILQNGSWLEGELLIAGEKVAASDVIEKGDCTPGETYYFAAAAVSETGEYSEVATISLTAAGTDCSFEFTIITTTDERLSYIL